MRILLCCLFLTGCVTDKVSHASIDLAIKECSPYHSIKSITWDEEQSKVLVYCNNNMKFYINQGN